MLAYRTILDHLDAAFALLGEGGVILATNGAVQSVLGWDPEALVGTSAMDLIHPAEVAEAVRILTEVAQTPLATATMELRARTAAGEWRWLQTRTVNLLHEVDVGAILLTYRDIHAQHTAQTDLQAREQELRLVIEQTGDGIITADRGGVVRVVNEAAARQHGVRKVGLEPRKWLEAYQLTRLDGSPLPLEEAPLFRALHGEVVASATWGVRRPDGEWRILSGSASPLLDDEGQPAGAVLVTRDETERQRMQAETDAHLRHLEAIRRISQVLEQTVDVEQAMHDALQVVLDLFGADRAWLATPLDLSAPWYEVPFNVYRPAWPPGFDAGTQLPMSGPALEIITATALSELPVTWGPDHPLPDAQAWRDAFGIQAQMLVQLRPRTGPAWALGIHQCETPRRWTQPEQLLFRDLGWRIADVLSNLLLFRDLKRSEARLRHLTEALPQLIWVISPTGQLEFSSRRAMEYTGLEADPNVANAWLESIHAEDQPGLRAVWHQAVERQESYQFEARIRRAEDGLYRWHLMQGRPERSGDGVRWFVTATDIEAWRRDQEALRTSQEQLRQAQKMEAIGRLAGGVAHDFNNLLTAINGYADLLLTAMPQDAEERDSVEEIHRAGQRAAALTGQLLAFSRRQVLMPKRLDLNAVVADLDRLLRRLIGEDVTLQVQTDPTLGAIRADQGQIEQVVLNLALNARDAMPQGGLLQVQTKSLDLEAGQANLLGLAPGRYAVLTLRDTGTGMDAETQAHAFEPFFTTKPRGQGTGLGLATAYGILTQSGARITVDSAPGQGTTFDVYFPCVDTGDAPSHGRDARQTAPRGTETVLLAEDEAPVRRFVQSVLTQLGYRVLAAASGDEALKIAATHTGPLDLLLTDVVMPGMGGRELAERLRGTRPGLPVLYVSGYTDDAVLRHGVREADVTLLQKPFTAAALAVKVREVIEKS